MGEKEEKCKHITKQYTQVKSNNTHGKQHNTVNSEFTCLNQVSVQRELCILVNPLIILVNESTYCYLIIN